jgi:hypothetical protein
MREHRRILRAGWTGESGLDGWPQHQQILQVHGMTYAAMRLGL